MPYVFDVNTLTSDEVLAEPEVAVKYVNLTVDEVTLAQALVALISVKPKVKEPSVPVSAASTKVSAATTTTTATIPTLRKGIERVAREKDKANVSLTEEWDDIQAKIEADYELAQRLQAQEQKEFSDAEKATLFNMEGKKPKDLKNKSFNSIQKMFDGTFKRVNTFVDFRTELVEGSSKRAGTELEQESIKKQKVDEDKETSELQSLIKVISYKEEVAIDVVPLATKPPTIVD
ncbi:hypothetical protein Tco_1143757 [Tanacetum coccineum]